MRLAFIIGCAVACGAMSLDSAMAHPGHFSAAEIDWNSKTGRFEIALRMRLADLDDAISLRHKQRVSLERSPQAEDLLREYLADTFSITFSGDDACRLHWVGVEHELHDVWVYFEAESLGSKEREPADEATESTTDSAARSANAWDHFLTGTALRSGTAKRAVTVKNRVLMEVQPEQTNVVRVQLNGRTESVVLSRVTPQAALFTPAPQASAPKTDGPTLQQD